MSENPLANPVSNCSDNGEDAPLSDWRPARGMSKGRPDGKRAALTRDYLALHESRPANWLSGSLSASNGVHGASSSDTPPDATASSYSDCASIAGPRRTPSAFTRIVRERIPWGTTMMSPTRIRCLAFLTTTPLRMIAPAVQMREASERLFVRRANHSH